MPYVLTWNQVPSVAVVGFLHAIRDIRKVVESVREPTGAKAAKNDGSERQLEERAPTGEARLRVPGGASARERNATAIAPSRVERYHGSEHQRGSAAPLR